MTWELDLEGLRRPSRVVGGRGAFAVLGSRAGELGAEGRRAFVVTDDNVWAALGPRIARLLGAVAPPPRIVTPGEKSKSVDVASGCWEWLARSGARRDDVVVAVGGGVVGDLAGFVASTYLRGIGLWQVPTSLLAQVDSSVGGKVALDLTSGKNLVGAFYQPDLVVVDPEALATLPAVEYRAGMGEVVKYGLLDPDGLLGSLEQHVPALTGRRQDVLDEVVRRCLGYKARVILDDEEDQGSRAVLNLGHTAAHALEAALGFGALAHGVAVGLGLLVALTVSEEAVGLDPSVRRRTRSLLAGLGLPVAIAFPSLDAVLEAAGHDKKVSAAGLGFVCLKEIGEPVWGVGVTDDLLRRALKGVQA